MTKNQSSVGLLILAAGVVILLGKLGVFSFIGVIFWPLFVLIPGILLHVLYFGRILPSIVLIPAGMLSVYGLLFMVCNIIGWEKLQYLWPIFILGVAVGLYEYHLFDYARPKGARLVAIILALTSAAFFGIMLLWSWGIYLVGLIMIVVGAWMVFGRARFRW